MSGNAWGIKLGSRGACVPFCERHEIVGIGWAEVAPELVATGEWEPLWAHVNEAYAAFYQGNRRKVSSAVGTLHRFGQQCEERDFILYYDPPRKHVRVCRVVSGPLYRDFDMEDPADIWHYRRVEYATDPIPILDFYGGLKGSLLGPQGSFWNLSNGFEVVQQLVRGEAPHVVAAPDSELQEKFGQLRELLVKRAEALNEQDWEYLVVDYLRAQGGYVDEQKVGGNQPIIDAEAHFDHGELPNTVWRVQVKRWQGQVVDWKVVEESLERVGEAGLVFVSVFGFSEEAKRRADDEGVVLLEAGDFTRFLLSGKLRASLRDKMQLPPLVS